MKMRTVFPYAQPKPSFTAFILWFASVFVFNYSTEMHAFDL